MDSTIPLVGLAITIVALFLAIGLYDRMTLERRKKGQKEPSGFVELVWILLVLVLTVLAVPG